MNILLAEDEPAMSDILQVYLKNEGYAVTVANDGEEALEAIHATHFDLLILDWMMPKLNGIEVAKVAKTLSDVKIIMITAKSTQEDEWLSLNSGMDDFIRKPFDPRVLMLRVKRQLNVDQILNYEALSLNLEAKQVKLGGQTLELTAKEYELLCYFMRNSEKVLSRQQLVDAVWGYDFDGDYRTVDTQVKRLRTKIGESFIKTIRGMGYQFGH
jgi:DNA-binding response OmpR family regulator